jgi:hypothetical protein
MTKIQNWIPAFAGMTMSRYRHCEGFSPWQSLVDCKDDGILRFVQNDGGVSFLPTPVIPSLTGNPVLKIKKLKIH